MVHSFCGLTELSPLLFNLSQGHLGDVLMALPTMRWGDAVYCNPKHRVPNAPVFWLDSDQVDISKGIFPGMRRGRHTTDAWIESTGRVPIRHTLLDEVERTRIVIAPDVEAPSKKWPTHRWMELHESIIGSELMDSSLNRLQWMHVLNSAKTVICPDTGTAHMADALGCPQVIVLHGVMHHWPHCAPYWDRRYCIFRSSMKDIQIDDVLEKIHA